MQCRKPSVSHNSQIAQLSLQSSSNYETSAVQLRAALWRHWSVETVWVLQYTKLKVGKWFGIIRGTPPPALPSLIALFLTCNLNVHLQRNSAVPSYSWKGMLYPPQATKPAAKTLLEGWFLHPSNSLKENYPFISTEMSEQWEEDANRAVKRERNTARFVYMIVAVGLKSTRNQTSAS